MITKCLGLLMGCSLSELLVLIGVLRCSIMALCTRRLLCGLKFGLGLKCLSMFMSLLWPLSCLQSTSLPLDML